MAWLPKVSLGNLGDLAGAVSKLSESVKSLERNFDSALGFDAAAGNAAATSGDASHAALPAPPGPPATPTTRPPSAPQSLQPPPAEARKSPPPALPPDGDAAPDAKADGSPAPAAANLPQAAGSASGLPPIPAASSRSARLGAIRRKGLEQAAAGRVQQPPRAAASQQMEASTNGPLPLSSSAADGSLSDSRAEGETGQPSGKSSAQSSGNDAKAAAMSISSPPADPPVDSARATAAGNDAAALEASLAPSTASNGPALGPPAALQDMQLPAEASPLSIADEEKAGPHPTSQADSSAGHEEVAPGLLNGRAASQAEAAVASPIEVEDIDLLPAESKPDALPEGAAGMLDAADDFGSRALDDVPQKVAGSKPLEVDLDDEAPQSGHQEQRREERPVQMLMSEPDVAQPPDSNGAGPQEDARWAEGRPAVLGEVEDESGAVKLEQPRPPPEAPLHSPLAAQAVQQPWGAPDHTDVAKLQKDLHMMEVAVQAAAKQAQTKADELAKYMAAYDELKASSEEEKTQMKRAANVELEALREEFQTRVGAAERKVYALTRERDMLRREQSRRTDTSALLKQKDEMIKQIMEEGEELSRKRGAQETAMKKLRAQIRELEEEKVRLAGRLQVEEARVESSRKDKAATEKALSDAVERGQAELAAQKEFYTAALSEARDALAKAEAKADSEQRAGLDRRLREAADREHQLLLSLDELRQALSRSEEQAAFREDMLKRDLEDLEKRCQESTNMRVEAWKGVERALNTRLQDAEVKAASAQERERAANERLTQALSRLAVMEAQLSCLRAEHAQVVRSLEKERARAAEGRQEYLAAAEAAATHEGRAAQLEQELRDARSRARQELANERARREALEQVAQWRSANLCADRSPQAIRASKRDCCLYAMQEIEHERAALADYEKRIRNEGRHAAEKAVATAQAAVQAESGAAKLLRRLSSGSMTSVEENSILHQSLGGAPDSLSPSPSFSGLGVRAATQAQLDMLLRQKEGELASYTSRIAALESTRDSLAEELVNSTTLTESLRAEVASLPGLRAELEALRRRHSSALELMGERDEQVEELRADLHDVKQMYREQIDMLVSQIERLSSIAGNNKSSLSFLWGSCVCWGISTGDTVVYDPLPHLPHQTWQLPAKRHSFISIDQAWQTTLPMDTQKH
eukprot:SM000188S03837  [mRNA]  locus=s188:271989:278122:- [translate_table: standard]